MDFKVYDKKPFVLHQAANISLNGRFEYVNFTLAPDDPRTMNVNAVDGSFLNKVASTLRAKDKRVRVECQPRRADAAREGARGDRG